MSSHNINNRLDFSFCGDAEVLVPADFKAEFGKHRNIKHPQLACSIDIFAKTLRSMTASLPEAKWQYAMKSNDHPGLIATVLQEGHGFDCSSVGELQIVMDVAKFLELDVQTIASRCSLGNPNVTSSDLGTAFKHGIRMFSVDSKEQINKIAIAAPGAFVYLRTYVEATQKSAISVFTDKFGAPSTSIPDLASLAKSKGLVPYSIGVSVGGGNIDPGAFAYAIGIAGEVNKKCQARGVSTMKGITYCGGLPAPSAPGAPTFKTVSDAIKAACIEHGIPPANVAFEPGRSLATSCGIIEAHVIIKKAPATDNGVYDLVLDIGPFKGLYEFVRTNLKYKIAAYYDDTTELVPCRIFDDTCDSKGVCFKAETVMMPKSLTEGGRVYFLETGAYTTAYVMQDFNRTSYLQSFCFPDPFSNLSQNLPPWLQGVELPGEAAHRGKDMTALWNARKRLTNDEQRVRFSVTKANGSGRLGMGLLHSTKWMEARGYNTGIINYNSNQTGSELRIGFQPQYLFAQLHESWIANSSFLTASLWNKFEGLQAAGGATVHFCLSNQYRSNVKLCTLMHSTLVIKPDNHKDGPPQFIEVNYNPYTIDGLNPEVLERAFGNELRMEKVYRDPAGDFEQLLAGGKLHPALAHADLVWGGPIGVREPLESYWPDATAKDGNMRPINLEGVLEFRLDCEQFSILRRHTAFLNASYEAGHMVTNNAHDDANQCTRTTARMLMIAIMRGEDNHFDDGLTTDEVIKELAGLANKRLWLRERVWEPLYGGHGIASIDQFELDADEVSAEKFTANVQSILCHPTMMKPFGGENAYNTIYMSPGTLPHRDYDAQQLYRADAKLAIELLAQKYDYTGAREGQRSFY